MGYIGNAPFGGQITGDNVLDGSIKAEDLAPGAAVPTQTGQSGKYLTTDGTTASWGTVSQVPSQTGQTGKYLTTDGTTASWSTVATGVRVTGITYSGNDLATSPNGGQTVTLAGSGFASTPTVFVDGTIAPSVSFVSSSQITFVTPAKSAGTYHVYVVNPDGSTAIFVNGISYSGVPTWTTAAGSLGTYTGTFSIQLVATGDAPITYTLATGSSLPAGVALSSSGLISGTLGTEQTFSFSVDAVDAQNQETPRSFSVTVVLSDPYFEYNALLLSGNGANGSQNNTFLDGSTNNFTITRNGNTTQGTFSPFSQTGWGAYFDGTGDYLSTNATQAIPATGDFTIEAWVYPTVSGPGRNIVSQGTSGSSGRLQLNVHTDNTLQFAITSTLVYSTGTVTPNAWNYIAVTRTGSSVSFYINNGPAGTATLSGTVQNTALWVGSEWSGDPYRWLGYISNVRISNVVRTITAAPTAAFTSDANTVVLTCQSNRFIDNSTNAYTITRNGDVSVQAFSPFNPTAAWSAATYGGSGYFDGSGDYLSVADAAAMELGSGNWTIEMWVNTTNSTAYSALFARDDGGTTAGSYVILLNGATANGIVSFWSADVNSFGAAVLTSGTVNCRDGAWHHIAVVRNSNTLTMYIDGTSTSTATFTGAFANTAQPILIGAETGYSRPYTGYMANIRLVIGAAVYTANFTPPTAPLTAISNTQLLLNFTNAGIYDATSKNDLETVGNAQISTTQSKFGGSSIYLDGNGDRLIEPASPNLALGSGDFTIECWLRRSSASSAQAAILQMSAGADSYSLLFGYTSGASLVIYISSNGSSWDIASAQTLGTVQNDTWVHYALTRYGSTFRAFQNGVQQSTWTSSASIYQATNQCSIGYAQGTHQLAGYINDLRITKGIARYTSNFTPPTTAFLTL